MRIVDYRSLLTEPSAIFISDNTCGKVVKTPEDIGENLYGVYIPRMMMGIDISNGPKDDKIKIPSSKLGNTVNKKIGEDEIISSNFITLTMDTLYNISMPTLILGEEVTIGLIDNDIKSLYIKPFNRDQIKRRPVDKIRLYVPASGKYDTEVLNEENSYFVEVNSIDQMIKLHTSKGNGEISPYDILIDGKNGKATITDGKRSITLDTPGDEIYLKTDKGASVLSLQGGVIDLHCEQFNLKASQSITIECPKTKATLDNIEQTTKVYKGKVDSSKIEGDKLEYKISTIKGQGDKIDIKCTTTMLDGLVSVSGFVCAGGIGFGVPAGQQPKPNNPQISKKGMANFKGPAGLPLVKGQPLVKLLMQIGAKVDTIGGAVGVPPTCVTAVSSSMSSLTTPNIKG